MIVSEKITKEELMKDFNTAAKQLREAIDYFITVFGEEYYYRYRDARQTVEIPVLK